jgi:murein DD-endopeptidase MepM/ murein hydrolase activator NlpD
VEKLFHLAKITKSGTSGKILFVLGMLSFSLVNCSSLKGMPQNTSFLINPVPSGKITLDYGFANHPITKERFKHSGVDLAANAGTPILASGDGIVIAADTNDQTGNFILIAHEDGIETFYSHMDKVLVMKGRQVPKGGKIGAVGSTGVSTGPHLHFEIRRDGHAIDPHTMVTFD